jgi:hypothetical protein
MKGGRYGYTICLFPSAIHLASGFSVPELMTLLEVSTQLLIINFNRPKLKSNKEYKVIYIGLGVK